MICVVGKETSVMNIPKLETYVATGYNRLQSYTPCLKKVLLLLT